MAGGLRGATLDRELDTLLAKWELLPPDERPIDAKHVAEALRVSRTSLYKPAAPGLDYPDGLRRREARIKAAAARQADCHGAGARGRRGTGGAALARQVREVMDDRDRWKRRCEELQLKIAGMELQATRLNWDAGMLWRPLPANDRQARGRVTLLRGRRDAPWRRR